MKVFYKIDKNETYSGFLWDPTLSGYIITPKKVEEKLIKITDGVDIFKDLKNFQHLEKLLKGFTDTENKLNELKK